MFSLSFCVLISSMFKFTTESAINGLNFGLSKFLTFNFSFGLGFGADSKSYYREP